jgi:hypothetical protein
MSAGKNYLKRVEALAALSGNADFYDVDDVLRSVCVNHNHHKNLRSNKPPATVLFFYFFTNQNQCFPYNLF